MWRGGIKTVGIQPGARQGAFARMHSFDAATDLSAEPTLLRGMTPEQKDRLSDLLDRYLASLESGVPVDPEEMKRTNPDLADALTVYLQNLDQLHDAAAGFAG